LALTSSWDTYTEWYGRFYDVWATTDGTARNFYGRKDGKACMSCDKCAFTCGESSTGGQGFYGAPYVNFHQHFLKVNDVDGASSSSGTRTGPMTVDNVFPDMSGDFGATGLA
jgi:hypothetical protein